MCSGTSMQTACNKGVTVVLSSIQALLCTNNNTFPIFPVRIFIIFMTNQKWSFVFTSQMYGELHSPNYPEHYSAPLDKDWVLEVPPGYHIQLEFSYLNIKPSQDCRNDSLTVHVTCNSRYSSVPHCLYLYSIYISRYLLNTADIL